jgi:hypothetical protein
MYQAITREKQIKTGSRESKIKLIEKAIRIGGIFTRRLPAERDCRVAALLAMT